MFDLIYDRSAGVPRLINLFCDFALLTAFEHETLELRFELVEKGICELGWGEPEKAVI